MTRPHCQAVDACQARGAGHCRRCWGLHLRQLSQADPEVEQRRRETVRARAAVTTKARWQDPVYRQKMTEAARERKALCLPHAIERRESPEARAKLERNRHRTVMAMSPEERRRKYGTNKGHQDGLSGDDLAHYRTLIAKRIPSAKAREMIDELARRRVARAAEDMRARHEREKAQAY